MFPTTDDPSVYEIVYLQALAQSSTGVLRCLTANWHVLVTHVPASFTGCTTTPFAGKTACSLVTLHLMESG